MKCLIILSALLPALSFAQKLKVNEYDRFTKQRRIELEPLSIYSAKNAVLNISYYSFGSVLYVQFTGVGWGASAVDENQQLIFLLANDSTISVNSIDVQTAEMNSSFQTAYKHGYFIKLPDVKLLSQYEVVGIRKYTMGDLYDLKLTKDNALKIKKLSSLFLEELRVGNIFRPMQEIDVSDIAKHIGDSVRFCAKVHNARYFETVRNKPTILDVKNNLSSPLNVIIWDRDRKNFGNAPETIYNNKDVCISGLVESSNNIPQIIVRNRDQISMKSTISLAEADKFVGDSVTVSGRVVTSTNIANSGTVLNMDGGFPGQTLTVLINNQNKDTSLARFYANKEISVKGKVEMVDGNPQIVVQNRNQIVETPGQIVPPPGITQQTILVNNTPPPTQTKSIEQSASFPGGHEALLDFLKANLICPEDELKLGQKKVVVAKFLIQPDGTASDIEITQPAGVNFDKEVIRVLKLMPRWEPQMTNGTPVPVSVTQPITFVRRESDAKKRAKS